MKFYYFQTQYKNKDKNFRCSKKITEKCRGSVTLSPNETIVRKRVHTWSVISEVDNTLEDFTTSITNTGQKQIVYV